MKLSDALVEVFLGLGVRHVFGVSGANIEHLHDALYRAGRDRIESVLAKTETGAAFMADAQARVHGVLGVCCATSGGGMMNLAVGIAESYQASVPVLAIVGQTPAALDGRGAFQESTGIGRTVDALAMMRAISKFSARIDDAGAFWSTLRDALVACFEGRPGPAVLLVPRDRFDAEVGEMPAWFPRSLEALRSDVEPNVLGILMLAQELRRAKRPALLVGPFAGESARKGALRRFAEAMQLPVFTTMEAVTAFPQEHRLFAGVVGAAGHPSAHAHIMGEVDRLVDLYAGGEPEAARKMFRDSFFAALSLEEARDLFASFGLDPQEVNLSSDRHWTFDGRLKS
jgi:acetolactate synthase-1/2/3 large subunit